MARIIALFAVLFFAGAPLVVLADTYSVSAPADEYFGRHNASVLEIRNRLDRLDSQGASDMLQPGVTIELDDIQVAILDWQRRYPGDPWLPTSFERLLTDYQRAGAIGTPGAQLALTVMRTAYPDAEQTASVLQALADSGQDVDNSGDDVYEAAQPAYPAPMAVPVATVPIVVAAPIITPGTPEWVRYSALRSPNSTYSKTTSSTTTSTTTTTVSAQGDGTPP